MVGPPPTRVVPVSCDRHDADARSRLLAHEVRVEVLYERRLHSHLGQDAVAVHESQRAGDVPWIDDDEVHQGDEPVVQIIGLEDPGPLVGTLEDSGALAEGIEYVHEPVVHLEAELREMEDVVDQRGTMVRRSNGDQPVQILRLAPLTGHETAVAVSDGNRGRVEPAERRFNLVRLDLKRLGPRDVRAIRLQRQLLLKRIRGSLPGLLA